MTVTVRTGEPGWSKTPHRLARDVRLSNGARGLAVQLLSHTDGFRSDEEFLVQCSADSRNEVRRQIAELRKYGYLVRERVRGADGKLATRSVLYDVPQMAEPPVTDSPTRRTPASRSDLGKFEKGEQQPAAAPWRDGPTSTNTKEPQVTPSGRPPASRSEQGEQDITAGRTDSPGGGAHIEDQRGEQKKISQSAQDLEGVRWLHGRGYGLTDSEALVVISEARRRARGEIEHLVAYFKRMGENGELLDIVEAVQFGAKKTGGSDDDRTYEPEGVQPEPGEQRSPDQVSFGPPTRTCAHPDGPVDPLPVEGWGDCLTCNQARRKAARPQAVPVPEGLKATLERARINQRDKAALKAGRPIPDPAPLDAETFARLEANFPKIALDQDKVDFIHPAQESA